ncbi:hypothetical protein NDU88_005335 [Pleurodeles waltl]|uniref:Uncharacterized protein n=1 Tax=Pleurodeles waltl TaxID=8319 RepID=A0AAV7UJL5_PLEWA|nr:hypothetical protein NDU88_005335 [Pleurodeles waltl]
MRCWAEHLRTPWASTASTALRLCVDSRSTDKLMQTGLVSDLGSEPIGERYGVGVSVTAFSQFHPPGEPKERRPRRPRWSSLAGGEFSPGAARFSSPAVVLAAGAKNVNGCVGRGGANGRRIEAEIRPAFITHSPPRFSCQGGRRAAAEAVAAETGSGTGLILACRSFAFVVSFTPQGGSKELH